MRSLLAALTLIAVTACGFIPASADASGPASSRAEVEDLAARINRHRVAIGCKALIFDRRLTAVAQRHSEDMVRRDFFDHTNPDGRDPFERMQAAGIRYRAAAENIAKGQRRGLDTYEDWMESPGHRHNIENCVYRRYGIGLYEHVWTLELARYGDD